MSRPEVVEAYKAGFAKHSQVMQEKAQEKKALLKAAEEERKAAKVSAIQVEKPSLHVARTCTSHPTAHGSSSNLASCNPTLRPKSEQQQKQKEQRHGRRPKN